MFALANINEVSPCLALGLSLKTCPFETSMAYFIEEHSQFVLQCNWGMEGGINNLNDGQQPCCR